MNRINFVFDMLMAMMMSSCNDDDIDTYTPEYVKYYQHNLFAVPYNQFGTSKGTVKRMIKRQIKSESDSKIVVNGNGSNLFQVYYFENDKLVKAATFVPASEGYVYPTALSSTYKEWGTMSYKYSIFYAYVTFDFYAGMTNK